MKTSNVTPKAKPKVTVTPQPARGSTNTRVLEGESLLLKLDLQFFASKDAAKGIGNSKVVYPNKPHTNKTAGHWETMVDKANELAKSDNISKVYLNKGISNEIPGVKPNRRPDIMAVRKDGKIDQYEVPSKTDDVNALINRMQDTQRLLGDRAGNINILRIKSR